jgi:hypothetical protein
MQTEEFLLLMKVSHPFESHYLCAEKLQASF